MRLALISAVLVLGTTSLSVLAEPPQAAISKLIDQLADPDFKVRDQAAKALEAHGAEALPALRYAANHRDAEVRRRIEDCIATIEKPLPFLVTMSPDDRCFRQGFARRFSRLKEGMSASQVLAVIGKPDDVRTRDQEEEVEGPIKVAWCYGTDGHGHLPTLGSIFFDRDWKIVAIHGSEGEPPPAGLFEERELRRILRSINRSRNEWSRPLAIIQVVNILQPLGKEKAIAVIEECGRVTEPWYNGPYLLDVLNTLFDVPRNPGYFAPYGGGTIPAPPLAEDHWRMPRFPIWLGGDIPFNLVLGGFGGFPDSLEERINDFRPAGVSLRKHPLRPTATPLKVYEEFARSCGWLYKDPDSFERLGKGYIMSQLLDLLHTVHRPSDVDDNDYLTKEATALRSELQKRPIRWNEKKMIYTFQDGSVISGPYRRPYRREVWEMEDGPRDTALIVQRRANRYVTVKMEQAAPEGQSQMPIVVEVRTSPRKLLKKMNTITPGPQMWKQGEHWGDSVSLDLELREGDQIRVDVSRDGKTKESRVYRP
jgi:hypothetical protein